MPRTTNCPRNDDYGRLLAQSKQFRKIIPTSMGGAIAKHRLNTLLLSTGIKIHTHSKRDDSFIPPHHRQMCIKIIPTHKRFVSLEERNNPLSPLGYRKRYPSISTNSRIRNNTPPLSSGIENDTHPPKGYIHTLK